MMLSMKKGLIALLIIASVFIAYSAHAAVFTKDLDWGLQNNAQVQQLQTLLTAQGLYSGEITGNFYSLTLKAIKAFQAKEGISPANGYFGPKTRERANELMGAGISSSDQKSAAETDIPPAQSRPTATRMVSKVKTYEGIITQINMGDNTFVIRLRDGKTITIKNPLESQAFVSVKGVMDATTGIVGNISDLAVKDRESTDAIPVVMGINPGSGTVGSKITLTGTGFLKQKNSISIGDMKNALVDIPSSDGKTATFVFPAAPCSADQAKSACPQSVLTPGEYTISLSNANGLSNSAKFIVLALPQLGITTDILPQVTAGNRFEAKINGIGGAEGYIWRISEGKLPQDLLFAQSACTDIPCKSSARISGTPSTPGTYTFTVTLVSGQENTSRQFSIVVVQPLTNPY